MANPNFNNILDRQAGDVERPKPLPIGPYVWKIKGLPEHGESNTKKTPYVEFTCIPLQAMEDVDPDALEESLNRKSGKKMLADMVQKLTFYKTEDAIWRLKEFLTDTLKLDDANGEKTLTALVDEAPNCEFIGEIRHTPTKDGKGVFASIGTTYAA